ncbi:glycosyltransferase [Altericista sp. CCNU0014]|uniref:glycosyltransferase n=1 Tax=Altericista sp. CCNU0014 TaxID=3082949 RepID=UPI00384DD669
MVITLLALGLSGLSWIYLLAFRGRFWRCDQRLAVSNKASLPQWPSICAIVPARNEAAMLTQSLPGLLAQNYPGSFRVLLVDDQSTDGTAEVARQTAQRCQHETPLKIITAQPLPQGWSGKLWAVHQGIERVLQDDLQPLPDYFLLTDADILHGHSTLRQLAVKAEREHLDLVSLMVLLRCQSFWEKLLIPAFVFFFQKLYPFPWVNQSQHAMAAAAGGCILVRRDALMAVGGIEIVRKALIDDCALGAAIKGAASARDGKGGIWLGLTTDIVSLRPYPSLQTIWTMVARTAFTQLHYSFSLLLVSLLSMVAIYLVPPAGVLLGWATGQWSVVAIAALIWGLMTVAYWPTVRLYRLSPLWAFALPFIAALYTLMTADSALRHLQGRGGAWKGRVYATDAIK